MSLLMLFLTFLKIGAISFGGGYGMISVMRDEVVGKGLLSETEFLDIIGVAESTPGPIAVNMATFVGSTQYGFWGALLCTLGVVIPSFVIILLIAKFLSGFMEKEGTRTVLDTIKPCVVGIVLATGCHLLATNLLSGFVGINGPAVLIAALLLGAMVGYKKLTKKKLSPILLIILSAVLGAIVYGI